MASGSELAAAAGGEARRRRASAGFYKGPIRDRRALERDLQGFPCSGRVLPGFYEVTLHGTLRFQWFFRMLDEGLQQRDNGFGG